MDNTVKDKTPDQESFEDLNLKENLLRGIYKYGFDKPSPIQSKGIPLILQKRDLIAQSQSGTGKTGTFAIGTLQAINTDINGCQAIIIAPTRELAQQIHMVFRSLGKYTKTKLELCVGGTSINESRKRLKSGVHVVIGTPGRVIDMIERKYLITRVVRMLVVDEADELLRGTFMDQLKTMVGHMPNDTQICLFSATMPKQELTVTRKFLNNPIMILVEKEKLSLDIIKQFYVDVEKDQWKLETLEDIYEQISINQAIIYVNTKERAVRLQEELTEKKFTVSVMHSKMTPTERTQVMESYRKGNTRIIVSTDLLARGIDIQQVSVVVNYDLPKNTEHYLHRIGRSGRFGKKGVAINFITQDDIRMLEYLENFYNITIEPMPETIKQFL